MAITLRIEDALVPYLVLVFNSLTFYLLRVNLARVAPASIALFISEIVSTVELCADCAELGVVWEVHGNIGMAAALFLLCVWWSLVFDDAEACPCGPIEECLIVGRSFTSGDILQKLTGQLVGAYLTYKYINSVVWCWHLSEQHAALHTQPICQATLFVTPVFGAAIEGLITFISRIVALQSEEWSASVSIVINSVTTVVLVLFAMNTTGGYFNPITASALTFGCEGHTLVEHLIVYWVGALIGGLAARWCHLTMLTSHSKKD